MTSKEKCRNKFQNNKPDAVASGGGCPHAAFPFAAQVVPVFECGDMAWYNLEWHQGGLQASVAAGSHNLHAEVESYQESLDQSKVAVVQASVPPDGIQEFQKAKVTVHQEL